MTKIYKNEGDFKRDAKKLAKQGWIVSQVAATDGHINVGRTVLRVLTVAGLLFGMSRTSGKIIVVYQHE